MRARRAPARAALAATCVAWASCVSAVRPPAAVAEPARVYLIEEARHAGLVLPDGEARFVEYGYGEWGWYALGRDAWYDVFDTVLWPTRGALSRRRIEAVDESELRARRAPAELTAIAVERPRMEELRARLHAAFEAGRDEELRGAAWGVAFVPAERGFWWAHTCHDALAAWLRELGCEVSGACLRVGLSVEARAAP